MTTATILDHLQEIECILFYEYCHNPTEAAKTAHEAAKAALEAFAKLSEERSIQ